MFGEAGARVHYAGRRSVDILIKPGEPLAYLRRAPMWLVLLASPQAAASEWVNREVSWWLTHRSPDRILIVATDESGVGSVELTADS